MKMPTGITIFYLLLLGAALLLPLSPAEARFRGGSDQAGAEGPNFVDSNNDGVCDWAQSRQAWEETTRGQYGAWVDANGDGICDNYANRPQDGTGLGYRGGR